jgi:hypothetical protein
MPRPRFSMLKRRLTALAALPLAAAGLMFGTGQAAHAAVNPGPGFPAHFAAPYVETWGSTSAMANAQAATGLKYYTLAFVIGGGGCNATGTVTPPSTTAAGRPRSTICGPPAATSSSPSAERPAPSWARRAPPCPPSRPSTSG